MSSTASETDWSFLKNYPSRAGYLQSALDHLRERISDAARGRPTKAQLQSIVADIDAHRDRIALADAELDAERATRRRDIDQSRRDLGMSPVQWEAPR